MHGSAECSAGEQIAAQGLLATGTDGPSVIDQNPTLFDTGGASLREAAAQRIAAHRSRRAGAQAMEAAREEALRQERARVERESRHGVASVRDAVRARYEKSQSYRDFLAAESQRALDQARAEAEIAARNARAIANAQLQLLQELQQAEAIEEPTHTPVLSTFPNSVLSTAASAPADAEWRSGVPGELASLQCGDPHLESPRPPHTGDLFAEPSTLTEITTGGLTVRLYDGLAPLPAPPPFNPRHRFAALAGDDQAELEELEELEHEIAFRRAPEFTDHIIEPLALAANLIEFPRELVATRKARPRLAEGPLREELSPRPQLRIFEVESEQISTAPAAPEEAVTTAPIWQGMLLDTAPALRPLARSEAPASALLDPAPLSRRLMAAAVDACLIGVAVIAFATMVAWISGPRLAFLPRPLLGAAVVFTLALSALLYQLLFFSLNESTPGMRYARIALCTFTGQSPTRRAKRRRLIAALLAACPLGLGLLWAWMDDDRLAWHDRISRMYQRCY